MNDKFTKIPGGLTVVEFSRVGTQGGRKWGRWHNLHAVVVREVLPDNHQRVNGKNVVEWIATAEYDARSTASYHRAAEYVSGAVREYMYITEQGAAE